MKLNSNIDEVRLFTDTGVTKSDIQILNELNIPSEVFVTSGSKIKIDAVADILSVLQPDCKFSVNGLKVSSEVDEEPLGIITIQGAINRLQNGIKAVGKAKADKAMWVSIEGGLFRRSPNRYINLNKFDIRGAKQIAESVDLTQEFDSSAEYEDRAVVIVKIPDYAEVIGISYVSEAILIPKSAMLTTARKVGGFVQNTVGETLQQAGAVKDGQNYHLELSINRIGGSLPRPDQMARVITRCILAIAKEG